MWIDISENYEVSSEGHIRNKHTHKVLKEFVGKDGYLRTQFDGKSRTVHRTVAQAFIPQDPDRPFINHKDGNKQNNCIDNLEWCTRSENMHHAYNHGLKEAPIGTANGRCKLSEDDVDYIRANFKPNDRTFGARPLSKRFGVAPQTISAVMHGQNWRWKENS